MFRDKIRVLVGGDAIGGWLVDLHDGENTAVYSPDTPTQNGAVKLALADHAKAFKDAPTDSDYEPLEDTAEAEQPAAAAQTADEGAAPAASDANSKPAEPPQA